MMTRVMWEIVKIWLALISLVVAFFLLGADWQKQRDERAAVEAGVASYMVNPRTGETGFQYKIPDQSNTVR